MSSKKPADTTEKASDDGEDDDESPKPKSFGKVAMANPTEGAGNSDNSTSQPFPTVFASLSLVPLVHLIWTTF
jgi:hypothetical protein